MEEFFTRTKVYFGTDALQALRQWEMGRLLIVTDPFFVESGMIELVTRHLEGKPYQIFSKVMPDPPLELVMEGIREAEAWNPDTVLAVGGGSAIDEAKAILYFSRQIRKEKEMQLIAVPTTSGTGSEVTSFAVITDKEKGVKYPLVSEGLLPDTAILDPSLVMSVPPVVVADTGMDVLTHALEAYVSTKANPFTDALAETAALTVLRYLERSYENREDTEAKAMMHYASCMAGMAFDKASLGLNHALAHNIGGRFHVPHGRTNAILLPHILEFNASLTEYAQKDFCEAAIKYARLAAMAGLGGMNVRISVKNLIRRIQAMEKKFQIPMDFRACGITPEDWQREMDTVIAGAFSDTCIQTNPREPGRQELLELLKKSF